MTVKEYYLKFNQLSKCVPNQMADSRSSMSKFLIGVSSYIVKYYRSAMLSRDIDLSGLMIHAQQIKPNVMKESKKVRENKRVRSEQQGYG